MKCPKCHGELKEVKGKVKIAVQIDSTPEPLKGKVKRQGKRRPDGKLRRAMFTRGDVRSAVEWLKTELAKEIEFAKSNPHKVGRSFNQIIDEAFEDVVKTTKEKV